MDNVLSIMKDKSRLRRQLLRKQFGVKSDEDLSRVLGNKRRPRRKDDTFSNTSSPAETTPDKPIHHYQDSYLFLKGTKSANPHNDYSQHFVDTGQRPQNFIRDVGLADRFEEYPKLKELIRLKDEVVANTASPPMYLKVDLRDPSFSFKNDIGGKFDVIHIQPPLEEYHRHPSSSAMASSSTSVSSLTQNPFWSWSQIMSLPIEDVAAQRSFIFLWVGSGEGLDLGRQCLKKWGFRRCEDIVWIKTNVRQKDKSRSTLLDPKSLFQRTKEHCLMGIKGTVRRSTDGDFIHANVDIDLIITEEEDTPSDEKPDEIFDIIQHFCLGRRRLHVFGKDSNIRPGWLTIGPELTNSNFKKDVYWSFFEGPKGNLTGATSRIEALRPKSPPAKGAGNKHGSQSSVGNKSSPIKPVPVVHGRNQGQKIHQRPYYNNNIPNRVNWP